MIYLVLTILLSSYIFLLFKGFSKFGINTFQAIVTNYLVCTIIGAILVFKESGAINSINLFPEENWFEYAILLGCMFILVFFVLARTAQNNGVTVSSVAAKMSLVVPVTYAFVFYNETINVAKISGIVLALIAVFLVSRRSKNLNNTSSTVSKWVLIFFPALVFIGSGVIDTLVKYLETNYLTYDIYNDFLLVLFGTAFSIGFVFLMFQLIIKKQKFELKTLFAGILLGIPNYGSIYFLVKTLSVEGWESSMIFPVNNIAIVALATLGGIFLFKEKLSTGNYVGLGLAFLSIILISIA
ncbi:MAG: EamA family transporter [Bacteroidetes bacterium]|nr:EamA family transporter [Bacteroidota bacterium]